MGVTLQLVRETEQSPSPAAVLARIEQVSSILAEIQEPAEAAQLVHQADALAYLSHKAQLSEEAQRQAAEVALRAKRRAGELLAEREKPPAGRKPQVEIGGTLQPISPPTLEELGISKDDSARWQQIAKVPEARFEAYLADNKVREPTTAGLLKKPHVAHSSGNDEWFTPAHIIDVARRVMGGIDLDPASCAEANQVVKAERFFSAKDDGLTRPWYGRVWLNPPYSRQLIGKFIEKLISEWKAGQVEQICCLTNTGTETVWGQLLLCQANQICFLTGRVKFRLPATKKEKDQQDAPTQGQMLCYFGPAHSGFEGLGVVLRRSQEGGEP